MNNTELKLNLFTTYFFSDNTERQSEIDRCFKNNLSNDLISKVFIFLDKRTDSDSFINKFGKNEKISLIKIENIPMYSDWVSNSFYLDSNDITMFANADIYFDQTLNKVNDYLVGQNKIICLTRHEENDFSIQKQPEWSQDFWAMKVSECKKINFIKKLEIETGLPGCDNKLATEFVIAGWDLYNPFNQINCIHAHKSGIRNYEKIDARSAGVLSNVHESTCPQKPSEITINIMPINSKNIREAGVNIWLEEKMNERDRIPKS